MSNTSTDKNSLTTALADDETPVKEHAQLDLPTDHAALDAASSPETAAGEASSASDTLPESSVATPLSSVETTSETLADTSPSNAQPFAETLPVQESSAISPRLPVTIS